MSRFPESNQSDEVCDVTRRLLAGVLVVVVAVVVAGCGKGETKATIPDKLIEPPGADKSAGSPGNKKRQDADAKQSKQESGEDK